LRFLPLKSQFVLSGNVRDLQTHEISPGAVAAVPLATVLAAELEAAGFEQVLFYEPTSGFRTLSTREGDRERDAILQSFGLTPSGGVAPAGPDLLGATLQRIVVSDGPATALIIDFASRLVSRADSLSDHVV
jgi:hypothetical protein